MELKELFKKREDSFRTHSDEIFASVPNLLEGCKRFVSERGGDSDLLEWDDINFLDDDDIVVLMGSISYNPGDTVLLPNGDKVVVNENTANYFKAMLRLGIPYKLACTGTEDDIFNFLDETIEVEEIPDEPHPTETHDGVATAPDGFNLDDLTEDQRAAMELFVKTEGAVGENKN